jgi:hypothetical protein
MRRAVLALLLAGCSYDWTVAGGAASDAGRDVAPTDGSLDVADAQVSDVTTGSDASDASDAGPVDSGNAGEADAPDCPELIQNVASAFAAAKTCTGGCTASTCMTQTPDECGCSVVVCYDTLNQSTHDYVVAVNALKSSGCLAQYPCGDTCSMTTAACSIRLDAGNTYGCYY